MGKCKHKGRIKETGISGRYVYPLCMERDFLMETGRKSLTKMRVPLPWMRKNMGKMGKKTDLEHWFADKQHLVSSTWCHHHVLFPIRTTSKCPPDGRRGNIVKGSQLGDKQTWNLPPSWCPEWVGDKCLEINGRRDKYLGSLMLYAAFLSLWTLSLEMVFGSELGGLVKLWLMIYIWIKGICWPPEGAQKALRHLC